MVDTVPSAGLGARAARGAAWSAVSSLLLRLGGVVVGIVLARILAPEQFGVFAIALTVQGVLMTLADLGLSADLIRAENPERIAPTIATLGLVSGGLLAAGTAATSAPLAAALGSADAAPVIAVLSITLLLAGASVVPYGMLQRRFQQRELFLVAVVDFVVSTAVTAVLVLAGAGVMGLAIGRVAAQAAGSAMLFALARVRPRFGIDRAHVGPVLAFGLPIAGANLLSWMLLNVDNVVIARTVGALGLGFYVLAFNVSGWPMSALSQVVRSVGMPYFSRDGSGRAFAAIIALVCAAALPVGALLAVLAAPLIQVVYGEKWMPAAPVLAALGVYGGLRVVFDAFAGFLYAHGRSRPVLWVQLLSLVVLTGAMIAVAPIGGIVGAAWMHVAVSAAIILPAYLVVLRAAGVSLRELARVLWLPIVGSIPAVGVATIAVLALHDPLLQLIVGGVGAGVCHLLVLGPWLRARIRALRSPAAPALAASR